MGPGKKSQVGPGVPGGIGVEQVVSARIVLVHALLDQPHAENTGVEIEVLLCGSRTRRDVMQPVDAFHAVPPDRVPPIISRATPGRERGVCGPRGWRRSPFGAPLTVEREWYADQTSTVNGTSASTFM